ncbi:MAG: MacB family efflux pump subunit [Alphaproteobacteria bacterium]
MSNQKPLLELDNITKIYQNGDNKIYALNKVSLTIHQGEFVAIMGQSGSGKSTLMNIIGCLDKPTSGKYFVSGKETSLMSVDELARLRRETFGFVFQRYNLLATSNARENVEVPSVYAGVPKEERSSIALDLLDKLGVKERSEHTPSELSGGQQQRVAIARALVNDPPLILADEPTGALDSKSGEDVLTLLKQLNKEGRTIVLITHDINIASHAKRMVKISDGKIIEDTNTYENNSFNAVTFKDKTRTESRLIESIYEAVRIAVKSLQANLFRTALTLLGIIIGVAAVVTMLAIGDGSKQKIVDKISEMGTNLIMVRPGLPGFRGSGDIVTLVISDAEAIAEVPNVEAVVPERSTTTTVRYGNVDYQTSIQGVSTDFPKAKDWDVKQGFFFNKRDMSSYATVAVIGKTIKDTLFPYENDPINKFILIKNIPFQVIGIMEEKGANPMGRDQDDMILIPVTTGLTKIFGNNHLNTITVRVTDVDTINDTQDAITELLNKRHQEEDFKVRNMSSVLDTVTAAQDTLTILLAAVAAISLLVGGIGVMNIMLVSVTERTKEIGIRMATGARMRDIFLQFNIEAAVVSALGGVLGILFGVIAGLIAERFGMSVVFSVMPAALAFSCAFLTGLVFGFLPARKAAKLDPVLALATE